MDPKFFSAAQGIPMNAQQSPTNPRMLMQYQQQQQQQQQQLQQSENAMQQYPFGSAALGANFSGTANIAGNLPFTQDFGALDQTDLNGMNPFVTQAVTQTFMGGLSPTAAVNVNQAQHLRQTSNPQALYSQNLMNMTNGGQVPLPVQFQQNRALYQNNPEMAMISPNTPQAILYRQQQQAAINRAKQSPSQSPALNNAPFHNPPVGSPVIASSPHLAGARIGSDYAGSPLATHSVSPVQSLQGVGPSAQTNRSMSSQPNNRYMQQHMNANAGIQQQAMDLQSNAGSVSPSMNSNQATPSYSSAQNISQNVSTKDEKSQSHATYNANIHNYVQQSPIMQGQSPSSISRSSVPPASQSSTPIQQHQQLNTQDHMKDQASVSESLRQPAEDKEMKRSTKGHDLLAEGDSPAPDTSSPASRKPTPSPTGPEEQNGSQSPAEVPTVTYVPKTRNVETYGGVDLKYFDKFEIKPAIPQLGELGTVDIYALIMSLKSGMKMEITNALNVLTVFTIQQSALPLEQCEDLLDVLLDHLEKDTFGTQSRFGLIKEHAQREAETDQTNRTKLQELSYSSLFDMSLDEMKSLIPTLEHSTSDLWLSLRERCLCVLNILRNLSFMNENVEYLANHGRFVTLLAQIVDSTRKTRDTEERTTAHSEAWFVGIRRMDTLDFRKTALIIFANISMSLTIKHVNTAATFVELTHDFLTHGPDTYYSLLAIEAWTKMTVKYDNRRIFSTLVHQSRNPAEDRFQNIEDIWMELVSVIRRDYFSADGRIVFNMSASQLAMLELSIMGLYNIVTIAETETLKERLIQRDKSVGMTIMRLCIALAESGNQHFSIATKRGMELIRALICGGDGIRRRNSGVRKFLETKENESTDQSIALMADRVLDMTAVREKLMMATLKPSTDPEILRELSDLVAVIDDDRS
ncbi:hypothetical protein EC973_001276 [Apophysomyces ossiformis]|uniref:SWI/SNF-like complex subunit BAF250 C-terminal domain-containing protein n=1 Tax=Apophysomyces ossiformis TaxID=679940 RepID=A0A8H7BM77_9FUNG|nr:hypothetical protein EC973_001276 [Apophysomyces ossiformis]